MPRDITREEANSDWTTTLVDVGESAAFVSAGAAAFYRNKGGAGVSRFLNKTRRRYAAIAKELNSRSYDDWNKREVKSAYQKLKQDVEKINKEPDDYNVIQGNLHSPRSIFEILSQGLRYRDVFQNELGNINARQAKSMIVDQVIQNLNNRIKTTIKPEKGQTTDYRRFKKFIDKIVDSAEAVWQKDDTYQYEIKDFDPQEALWSLLRKETRSKEKHGLARNASDVAAIAIDIQQEVLDALNTYGKNKYNHEGAIENAIAKEALNIDRLELRFGNRRTVKDRVSSVITGDREATIGEILDAYNNASDKDKEDRFANFQYFTVGKGSDDKPIKKQVHILEELTKYLGTLSDNEKNRFRALRVDPFIRTTNGTDIYSVQELGNLKDTALDFAAGTMAGKILKLRDIHEHGKVPSIIELRAGSFNPILAGILNDASVKDRQRLQETHWYIGGDVFKQSYRDDGTVKLTKSDKLERGVSVFSGTLGAMSRMAHSMMGLNPERFREEGSLTKLFDVGGSTEINIFQHISGMLGIRDDGRLNMEGRLLRAINNPSNDPIIKYRNAKKLINDMEKSVFQLDQEAISKLLNIESNNGDTVAMSLLTLIDEHYYDMDNTSLIDAVLSTFLSDEEFHNEQLNKYVSQYKNNEWNFSRKAKSKYDQSGSYYHDASNWQDINDLLRTELSKEYFLHKIYSSPEMKNTTKDFQGFEIVKSIISNAGLSSQSAEATKRVGYLGYLDNATAIFHNNATQNDYDTVAKITDKFYSIFSSNEDHLKDASEVFKNIFRNRYSPTDIEKFKYDTDLVSDEFQEYVFMKKGISPIDLIRGLNDSTKSNEEKYSFTRDFLKQFNGGRNDTGNVTPYTFFPYFFTHRLSEGMNYFGLGFSNQSTASTYDMWKTIMFKRILPATVGYTYLEWGDDTFGAVTGTRASAVMVNGAANADLGVRKILDFTGVSSVIDSVMDFAPFQYWNDGDNKFNTYEQEKEYYENGYEPIRKGRYWAFGSANEFRGGQIEYFRPNLTRRLNSDYYNKSLYSSYWDKWSHSLLPTPTVPISPLLYILDPYYLENEHKKDRPYPVSAPMFSENTPWGIVLNPVIGQLIKPKKLMNQDRMSGGTDLMALIANMNNRVRENAMNDDQENIFILDNGTLRTSNFYAYDHPTPSEYIYRPGINETKALDSNGELNLRKNFGRIRQGINISEYAEILDSKLGGVSLADAAAGGNTFTGAGVMGGNSAMSWISEKIFNNDLYLLRYPFESIRSTLSSAKDRANGSPDTGEYSTYYGTGDYYSGALQAIQQANQEIRERAIAGDDGIFVTDRLRYHDSSINNIINRETEIQELIQKGKGQKLVEQMQTSARLISGIYGYMGNEFFGLGDFTQKHIANASEMDSFGRSFWDSSIGGIGGELSEISRRFIPEYRRRTSVNPLLNDMPDWMPEKYRTGDPYTKISYGEARLPGRGYEALNELHPDKYGMYGSLDRYKILADIAPYSEELKVWRKLAYKEHANDPDALKMIDEIQDRINEQSKQHDFYDYRFIGRNADYENAIISKVMEHGQFQIIGSDKIYKLAGVDFPSYDGDTERKLGTIMAPGAKVTIATDSNEYHKENTDGTVNAAVFLDGESVSQILYDEKQVKKRKGTTNAADIVAMHSAVGRVAGSVLELLGHTEFPLISSRWLKIQSPMESYKDEQVYGTPYQSWSEVLTSTVIPSWNKAISNPVNSAFEGAAFLLINNQKIKTNGLTKNIMMSGAMSLMDRGAFMGGAISHFFMPGRGDLFYKAQKIGFAAELIGNMYSSTQSSYIGAAMNWGLAGFMIGDFLDDTKTATAREALHNKIENSIQQSINNFGVDSGDYLYTKTKGIIEEFFRGERSARFRGKYIGGAAALGVTLTSMIRNGAISDNDHWIPEKTKKKWEIEDYFDRLTYLKYMGMYEQAARKAHDEEGVDIKKLLNQLDETQNEVQSIRDNLKDLIKTAQSHNLSNYAENRAIVEATNRLNQVRSSKLILKGGQYTRAAIMYKEAAENTMYGLKDNADWQAIASALPKYERDYFTEFMKEKDPAEQEKILREVSPFLRRALKQVWHYDDAKKERREDNEEYFQHHNLPNMFSPIWGKDADLNDVRAKVIKNEGMLPSDFGIYESQYEEASTINAPNINRKGSSNMLSTHMKLATILNGNGLSDADVTITPSGTSGIQTVINVAKVTSYNIGDMINKII